VKSLAWFALILTVGCESVPSQPDGGDDDTPDAPAPQADARPPDARPGPDAAGSCGSNEQCAFLDTDCVEGRCVDEECQEVPRPDGTFCDDGLFCTGVDACQGGTCMRGPEPCPPTGVLCNSDFCDEDADGCTLVPVPDGDPCDDSNACTDLDTCFGGSCSGVDVDCSYLNDDCNIGSCDSSIGCVAFDANEGGPCQDGLYCTVGDVCSSGSCVGTGTAACSPPQCHTATCDVATDSCVATPAFDGFGCDDANSCRTGSFCSGGSCMGGAVAGGGASCDDGLSCTSGTFCTIGGTCGGTISTTVFYFREDFSDNSAGWTRGPEWDIGAAMASGPGDAGSPDPETDHTTNSTDDGVAGVRIGGNAEKVLHDYYWLESPVFNATGTQPVYLNYSRWLNSDYDPYMHNRVDVWDGASWVNVWATGAAPGIADSAWTPVFHDVTAYRNAGMRVRFGFDITSTGVWSISSWNIDDVIVSSTTCE
jgi:hypothetical protein